MVLVLWVRVQRLVLLGLVWRDIEAVITAISDEAHPMHRQPTRTARHAPKPLLMYQGFRDNITSRKCRTTSTTMVVPTETVAMVVKMGSLSLGMSRRGETPGLRGRPQCPRHKAVLLRTSEPTLITLLLFAACPRSCRHPRTLFRDSETHGGLSDLRDGRRKAVASLWRYLCHALGTSSLDVLRDCLPTYLNESLCHKKQHNARLLYLYISV